MSFDFERPSTSPAEAPETPETESPESSWVSAARTETGVTFEASAAPDDTFRRDALMQTLMLKFSVDRIHRKQIMDGEQIVVDNPQSDKDIPLTDEILKEIQEDAVATETRLRVAAHRGDLKRATYENENIPESGTRGSSDHSQAA